ncbi:MAG: DNA polymerase III subunit gamma/tau [Pseudohongiellaceae bacterium]|jgi:DNA polymerase-3 subunit gamma/tau
MSYQVLARKWRPKKFAEVAGQGHVLKSLINALDNERLHHAYLFTGTRGVGKTTLARILAKCLNCEKGVTSEPCEACSTCTEINEGRFIDLIEVDAASRTKVEDTRELLDNVQYSSTRGRFKVYLIDEVHMLSNHSFNALLKTLEEPPAHVKFLFATTDPQKLPITILSRCLQFNLKNLSPKLIVEYLETVMQQEQIKCDSDALWQLAAAASGSMRDALTLADQAISYCQGEISHSGVIDMLGVPQQAQVFELLSAMAKGDLPLVLSLVEAISDHTPDYSNTLDSLLSTLHRIAIAQAAPTAVDNSFGDKQAVLRLAAEFAAEDIQLFYQLGAKGRGELRSGLDMRSAFEMLLLRMMIFSPSLVDQNLMPSRVGSDDSDQHSDLLRDGHSETPVERPQMETAGGPAVSETADSVQSQKKKTLADQHESDSLARQHVFTPKSVCDESQPPAEGLQEPTQSEVRRSDLLRTLTHESWLEVFPSLSVSGIVRNILANTQWEEFSEGILLLRLAEDQSALYSEEILPKLESALTQYFCEPVSLKITVGVVDVETPALKAQRLMKEARLSMVNEFETDTNVRELVDRFAATVETGSIVPLNDEGLAYD